MNSIRTIQALNKRELEAGTPPSASWHRDFADTAFIYIGGLPFELSEGDLVTIFSQYGEPVYVNLIRDKESGKSKGFAFLKYEDQRSTDLAVDNMGGATVMGRTLRVDHTRYKPKEGETITDNTRPVEEEKSTRTDRDGEVTHKKRAQSRDRSESEEEQRPLLKEERELTELMRNQDEDDPMKDYLVQQKREEVAAAVKEYEAGRKKPKKKLAGSHREPRQRSHRYQDEESEGERASKLRRDVREDRRRSPPTPRARSRSRSVSATSDYADERRRRRRHDYTDDRRREHGQRTRSRDQRS